jgi:phage N-6-adenine-methyltransferase
MGRNEKSFGTLFSSRSEEYSTPADFYFKLDNEFHFTLDPCASLENYKCVKYFTKVQNGLEQDWRGYRVYMNPPYGRDIRLWMKKAWMESQRGVLIVALVPARTDTQWFHDWVYKKQYEIRFLKGRLHFSGRDRAPFPSMVVIYKPENSIL